MQFQKGDVILHQYTEEEESYQTLYLAVYKGGQILFLDLDDNMVIHLCEFEENDLPKVIQYLLKELQTESEICLRVDKNNTCNDFDFYKKAEDLATYEPIEAAKFIKKLTNFEF